MLVRAGRPRTPATGLAPTTNATRLGQGQHRILDVHGVRPRDIHPEETSSPSLDAATLTRHGGQGDPSVESRRHCLVVLPNGPRPVKPSRGIWKTPRPSPVNRRSPRRGPAAMPAAQRSRQPEWARQSTGADQQEAGEWRHDHPAPRMGANQAVLVHRVPLCDHSLTEFRFPPLWTH